MINPQTIDLMKKDVVLINTGRGGLLDTQAVIDGLKAGRIAQAGLDVCEGEAGLFFRDHSGEQLGNEFVNRLTTFPNVLVTGHQGFLTEEALCDIARITLENVSDFEHGHPLLRQVLQSKAGFQP